MAVKRTLKQSCEGCGSSQIRDDGGSHVWYSPCPCQHRPELGPQNPPREFRRDDVLIDETLPPGAAEAAGGP